MRYHGFGKSKTLKCYQIGFGVSHYGVRKYIKKKIRSLADVFVVESEASIMLFTGNTTRVNFSDKFHSHTTQLCLMNDPPQVALNYRKNKQKSTRSGGSSAKSCPYNMTF